MKDKFWILVLIGIILLACTGGFLSYKHGFGEGYKEKICPICVCPDNYHKGFEDCKKIYEGRIDYCFDRCKYRLMVIGEPSHAACMWNCFYPFYPIYPIIGGCAVVHPKDRQQCCDKWAEENDVIIPLCVGQWEIVNQQCSWTCRLGITKIK